MVRKIEVGPYYVWLDVLEERLLNFWHTCTSMTIISSGPITHLSFLLNSHTGSRQAIIYLLHHLNLSIMVTSPKGAKLKGIYLIIEAGLNFHTPYTAITITVQCTCTCIGFIVHNVHTHTSKQPQSTDVHRKPLKPGECLFTCGRPLFLALCETFDGSA